MDGRFQENKRSNIAFQCGTRYTLYKKMHKVKCQIHRGRFDFS